MDLYIVIFVPMYCGLHAHAHASHIRTRHDTTRHDTTRHAALRHATTLFANVPRGTRMIRRDACMLGALRLYTHIC